jgi:hypothetical protein
MRPNFIDLTGQRFGRLLVVEVAGRTGSGNVTWKCQCDCGNISFPSGTFLRLGLTCSCGCVQREKNGGNNWIDITGRRFGRLVVIGLAGSTKQDLLKWECRCDCGKVTIVVGTSLRSGKTRSCGCLQRDRAHETFFKHGHASITGRSFEYAIWANVVQRTTNPNHRYWRYYGGRNPPVPLCERWRTFENFLADMGPKPSSKHTLERIDNTKGYEPANCEWRTRKEQARNTRRNRIVTIDGITACLSAICEQFGLPYHRLLGLITRYGYQPQVAADWIRQFPNGHSKEIHSAQYKKRHKQPQRMIQLELL